MILQVPSAGTEQYLNTSACSSGLSETQISAPSIATDGSGLFVFAWEGLLQGDSNVSVLSSLYQKSVTGATLLPVPGPTSCDEVISTTVSGNQVQPSCCMNAKQVFGVAWVDQSVSPNLVNFSIYQGGFTNPITTDNTLPLTEGSTAQSNPQIAISNTGTTDYIGLAWLETSVDAVNFVKVAVYSLTNDDSPASLVSLLSATSITSGTNGPTAVTLQLDVNALTGDFFVVWQEANEPFGAGDLIKGQKFNSTGTVGSLFVISNPTVSSASPRLAMRPYTDEFVVSWLIPDNGLCWSRLSMEDSTLNVILTPSPGVVQVPGASASANGDIVCLGDGGFVLSWISSDITSVDVTEYSWSDLPTPATSSNATLEASSEISDGAIVVNLDMSVTPVFTQMACSQNYLVVINADLSLANITSRIVPITDGNFCADFATTFGGVGIPMSSTLKIIGTSATDSNAMGYFDQIFFSERGAPTGSLLVAPASRTLTSMDAWLGTQDLILCGGPISNIDSLEFFTTPALEGTLQSTTGLISASFSLTGDGTAYGANAPQLSISNKNSLNSSFTLSRQLDNVNDVITDYALIIEPSGSSHKMLMLAGIRDFGTIVAAFILNTVVSGSNSSVPLDQVNTWASILNNNTAIIVKFVIPTSLNTSSPEDVIGAISPTGPFFTSNITLIPAQSITSDNP